jgi:hypothetical protein
VRASSGGASGIDERDGFLVITWSNAHLLSRRRAALVQAIDEAGEHAGDFFQVGLELLILFSAQELLPRDEFQQRDALLHAATRDAEEVAAIGPRGRPRVTVQIESANEIALW